MPRLVILIMVLSVAQCKKESGDPMTRSNAERFDTILSAVFFPRPDMPFEPEARGAMDRFFDVGDGTRLRLRLFLGDPKAPVILFFHGNGETGRDYDHLADAYRSLPASLVVAEYRGYGGSTGRPSMLTFLKDAHREMDEAKRILAEQGRIGPLVVMGRSLGSAPAIELASSQNQEIKALIVESGFGRLVPLLHLMGIPAHKFGITEAHGPENLAKMERISMPTLILHAEEDDIIPIREAEELFTASRDPGKVFVRVPHAGHNDIQARAGATYFEAIRKLLDRIR